MGADRESSFVLRFDGQTGTLQSVLSALKSQIRSDVADLESITSKVDLFKNVQQQADAAKTAFDGARAKVDELVASISSIKAASGNNVTGLEKDLAAAQKQLTATTRESDKQQASLAKLDAQLKSAGVNTANLASEEIRLAAALKQASTNATNQSAQQLLGLKTLRDIQPEINRLNAAYNTLSVSGTLSAKEIALAQQQLQAKTAELRASVTGVASAATAGTPELAGFFQKSLLPALGLTLGIGGVVAGIKSAVQAANEFSQGLAQIDTITNLSQQQLAALGQGARDLAKELGVDVNEAVRGLYELIRSGIPPDNALEVLRVSAVAAKAALTDTATGVKAANLLFDAFGASLDQLPSLFDKIIAGSKQGGATLKEFADGGGQLLNVARAAGISFDDLLATLTVLVDKSGNAEKSIGDLTKIIAKLDTSEARAKLRELGIEGDGLVDIFQQIGAKGLTLEQVLGVGLSGAGVKSAASLAALTKNSKDLPEALDAVKNSGGAAASALDKLSKTDKEKIDRLNAAIHDLGISFAGISATATPVIQALTAFFNAVNRPNASLDLLNQKERAAADAAVKLAAASGQLKPATDAAKQGLDGAAASATNLAAQVEQAAAASKRAVADLTDFSARLAADVQAIQQASAQNIADVTTRAEEQIAALDRSVQATAATATATLAIQTKANADKLTIIEKGEKDITAAVAKETDARAALARKNGIDEQKIATESAQIRIAALAPVIAQYQAFYSSLIQQEQDYLGKVNSISQQRVDFNRGIEKILFDIRLQGLSVFDQYVAKAQEADRLISLAREAGVKGDIEGAKRFTDEAIALAGTLKTVTDENGVVIVTQTQAQQQALGIVKKAQDGLNASFDASRAAAKAGADATKVSLAEVAVKLTDLQKQYDGLKKTIADGLDVKVNLDESSVSRALATLNDLTKPRTVEITVEYKQGVFPGPFGPLTVGLEGNAGNTGDNTSGGFNRGGIVPRPFARGGAVPPFTPNPIIPRQFASGGPVFAGRKVPGIGNADTFPAMLAAGSFVVKKAASQFYGDERMAKIARFASGGLTYSGGPTGSFFTGGAQNTFLYKDPYLGNIYTNAAGQQVFNQTGVDDHVYIGDIKGGSAESSRDVAEISFPELPSDPAERLRAVMDYVGKVRTAAITSQYSYWRNLLDALTQDIRAYTNAPSDDNLMVVLRRARGIGLNLGVEKHPPTHTGFDVDGRKWHKTIGTPGFNVPGLAGLGDTYDFYAKGGAVAFNPFAATMGSLPAWKTPPRPAFAAGGASTDTVPALLTPGEWVVPKPAVDRLGADFLYGINSMALPKPSFEALMAPPARPARFAEGGPVGDVPRGGYAQTAPSGNTYHITLQRNEDRAWIDRVLVPALEDRERKSKR